MPRKENVSGNSMPEMSETASFEFDVSLPTSLNRDTIECDNEEEHLKINVWILALVCLMMLETFIKMLT